MNKRIFVTGTDTNVGKTFVSAALLYALNKKGLSTLGLKPLASGCEKHNGRWENEDALILQEASSLYAPYEVINPIAFPDAIAPHLAAKNKNYRLSVEGITKELHTGLALESDVTLIEGAGGWYVPLNEKEFFSDFAVGLSLPVILVVGLRLGCINHALLTVAAIKQAGLPLVAWVANCVDPNMRRVSSNIDTLKNAIEAPCLGVVPYLPSAKPQEAASYLDSSILV
ncbi:MAG: dethiobiotin synthase [Pseudomonadales bacterium]|nr:dethiobiotin synthase [Pseudomonadales bacterium]